MDLENEFKTKQPNNSADELFSTASDRLLIAPCNESSAVNIVKLISASRVFSTYYMGGIPVGENNSRAWLHGNDDWTAYSTLNLSVRSVDNKILIGFIQLKSGNLSYLVNPDFWNRGYGSEMVKIFCSNIAPRLRIPYLRTSVAREHFPSTRILQNAGFTFIGLENRSSNKQFGFITMVKYELKLR